MPCRRRAAAGLAGGEYIRTSASPFEAFEPARRRDDFGDLDAIAAVDADDFALRDERAVGIDVEQVGRGAIELDHAAFTERETFGKRHRGRRSEERRVGKEWGSTCGARWSRDQYKKNTNI